MELYHFPNGRAGEYVTAYCTARQIPIFGVRRSNGEYCFYYVDADTCEIYLLRCLECQKRIEESDLAPAYSEWCDELNDYVIFMRNKMTCLAEQYRFCHNTGGFVQVKIPQLAFNPTRIDSVCKVEKEDYDEVVIQQSLSGSVQKFRYSEETRLYSPIRPVYVKTWMMQELEKGTPERDSNPIQNYFCGFCSHYQGGLSYIGVLFKGKPRKVYFHAATCSFHAFSCRFCCGPVTEKQLAAKYSVKHQATGNQVLFAMNASTYLIEQFIFNSSTFGFEQVFYQDLKYNPNFNFTAVLFSTQNGHGQDTIVLCDIEGRIHKILFDESTGTSVELPDNPVKLLNSNVHSDSRSNVEKVASSTQNSYKAPQTLQKSVSQLPAGSMEWLTTNLQNLLSKTYHPNVQPTEPAQQVAETSSKNDQKIVAPSEKSTHVESISLDVPQKEPVPQPKKDTKGKKKASKNKKKKK